MEQTQKTASSFTGRPLGFEACPGSVPMTEPLRQEAAGQEAGWPCLVCPGQLCPPAQGDGTWLRCEPRSLAGAIGQLSPEQRVSPSLEFASAPQFIFIPLL